MSLRPQDPIPDWITHLAILGHDYKLALAGLKEEVLFAVYRWANAYDSPKSGIVAKMGALMTERYGQPPTDIGHTLSSMGVSQYATFSRIMSSRNPSYVQPTGELAPEHLSATNRKLWQNAAEKPQEKASLDDILALTCLLPVDFNRRDDIQRPPDRTSSTNTGLRRSKANHTITMPQQAVYTKPLIELNKIVVAYGSKTVIGQHIQSGFSTPGLNLTIRRGTRLALLGPNGSGKTTFLSLLTSDHPQSYSLPIKYFGRFRLPSPGRPGLSLWEIQSQIGHSSPEIHSFFPKGLTIRRSLESAWSDTFAAKPKATGEFGRLVDTFFKWWEPELNQWYRQRPPAESSSPIDGWVSNSYPPFKHSTQTANVLDWASSPTNTFGTLPFQSQRLLLLLRAIIKSPDIVILDEAFSGLSPEFRDKAMLFLEGGEGLMPTRHQAAAYGGSVDCEDEDAAGKPPLRSMLNRRFDVEIICHGSGITVDDLLAAKETLTHEKRETLNHLRRMTPNQLTALAVKKRPSSGPPSGYAFTGLSSEQALVVVSHVREEIPDMVNEYMRLPGEEEVSEQGRSVELGRCEGGSIRTVEGWSKIWGLRT